MTDERALHAVTMLERTYSNEEGEPVDTAYLLLTLPIEGTHGEMTFASNDPRLGTPTAIAGFLRRVVTVIERQEPIPDDEQRTH